MTSKRRVIHGPVRAGLLDMLAEIFIRGQRTPGVLKNGFSKNRKWGGRDRRLVAEVIYESVRWWRRLYTVAVGDWSDESLVHFGGGRLPTLEDVEKCLDLQTALLGIEAKGRPLNPSLENQVQKFKGFDSKDQANFLSSSNFFFDLGRSELGDQWDHTLESLNQQAPVFLRMNRIKVESLDRLQSKLKEEGVETEPVNGAPDALKMLERKNVFVTSAYKDGWFEMQDASSQKVAEMIAPQKGEKIIDACAGAGGKSLHLSSLMRAKGKVISLDITKWKLNELKKRAARAGADNIETRLIEGKTIKRLKESADVLLLDVPCSGSGVMRRNADPKWQLNDDRFQELLTLQEEILRDYTKMLKPNGRLLYSTCSVFPSENRRQVEKVISGPLEGWDIQQEFSNLPQQNGHDGFYAALLSRPQ